MDEGRTFYFLEKNLHISCHALKPIFSIFQKYTWSIPDQKMEFSKTSETLCFPGGRCRIRTCDPLINSQFLFCFFKPFQ